jgi:hypothetical protein
MSDDDELLEEQLRSIRDRWKSRMRAPFEPWSLPAHTQRGQARMVAAMEYAAFQLGEINRRLARLVALTEEEMRRGRR